MSSTSAKKSTLRSSELNHYHANTRKRSASNQASSDKSLSQSCTSLKEVRDNRKSLPHISVNLGAPATDCDKKQLLWEFLVRLSFKSQLHSGELIKDALSELRRIHYKQINEKNSLSHSLLVVCKLRKRDRYKFLLKANKLDQDEHSFSVDVLKANSRFTDEKVTTFTISTKTISIQSNSIHLDTRLESKYCSSNQNNCFEEIIRIRFCQLKQTGKVFTLHLHSPSGRSEHKPIATASTNCNKERRACSAITSLLAAASICFSHHQIFISKQHLFQLTQSGVVKEAANAFSRRGSCRAPRARFCNQSTSSSTTSATNPAAAAGNTSISLSSSSHTTNSSFSSLISSSSCSSHSDAITSSQSDVSTSCNSNLNCSRCSSRANSYTYGNSSSVSGSSLSSNESTGFSCCSCTTLASNSTSSLILLSEKTLCESCPQDMHSHCYCTSGKKTIRRPLQFSPQLDTTYRNFDSANSLKQGTSAASSAVKDLRKHSNSNKAILVQQGGADISFKCPYCQMKFHSSNVIVDSSTCSYSEISNLINKDVKCTSSRLLPDDEKDEEMVFREEKLDKSKSSERLSSSRGSKEHSVAETQEQIDDKIHKHYSKKRDDELREGQRKRSSFGILFKSALGLVSSNNNRPEADNTHFTKYYSPPIRIDGACSGLEDEDSAKQHLSLKPESQSRNLLSPMDFVWRTTEARALSCTESSFVGETDRLALVAQMVNAAAATRSKSLCTSTTTSGSQLELKRLSQLANDISSSPSRAPKGKALGDMMGKITRSAINHIKKLSVSNPNMENLCQIEKTGTANYKYDKWRASSQRSKLNRDNQHGRKGLPSEMMIVPHQLNRFAHSTSSSMLALNNDQAKIMPEDDDGEQLLYSPCGVYVGPGGVYSRHQVLSKPSTAKHKPLDHSSQVPQGGAVSWLPKPLQFGNKAQAPFCESRSAEGSSTTGKQLQRQPEVLIRVADIQDTGGLSTSTLPPLNGSTLPIVKQASGQSYAHNKKDTYEDHIPKSISELESSTAFLYQTKCEFEPNADLNETQQQIMSYQQVIKNPHQVPASSKTNKPWLLNLTKGKSNNLKGSPPNSNQTSTRKKDGKNHLVACESSLSEATKSPTHLIKEARSNSLSGLNYKNKLIDFSKSSIELNCNTFIEQANYHPSDQCLRQSGSSHDLNLATQQQENRISNKHLSQIDSAKTTCDLDNNSFGQWSKTNSYITLEGNRQHMDNYVRNEKQPELYGANLQTICVHCQLIAELSNHPNSSYLNQLLPYTNQFMIHNEEVNLSSHAQVLISLPDNDDGDNDKKEGTEDKLNTSKSNKPSVVLTVCSQYGTIDNEDGHVEEKNFVELVDKQLIGEEESGNKMQGCNSLRKRYQNRSSSSASLISHSSVDDLNRSNAHSIMELNEELSSISSICNSDEDEDGMSKESSEDIGPDEDNYSAMESVSKQTSSSTGNLTSQSLISQSSSTESIVADNIRLDSVASEQKKESHLSMEFTQVCKIDAKQEEHSHKSRKQGRSSKNNRSKELNRSSKKDLIGASRKSDMDMKGEDSKTKVLVEHSSPVKLKSNKKNRKKNKDIARKKSIEAQEISDVNDKQVHNVSGLLEVPVNKQARSASLDAPYLLKVPEREDIEGSYLEGDSYPGKSNRSRSVDISLPTRPGESYTVIQATVSCADDVNSELSNGAEGELSRDVLSSQKKFIQGEIKVACANGETRSLKLFVNWKDDCTNGEHLWIYVGSSSEACYVGENECLKHGPRLCCSACKITAHTSCIGILIDKIKFICKHTFKDLTVNNPRHLKELQQQNVIYHHWVHKRTHCGRCKQCTKTFGNTKLPFSSKEIQAITCSWCKVSYHNKENCYTLSALTEPCTLGIHRESIIPPPWILKLPPNHHHQQQFNANSCHDIINDNPPTDNLIDISLTSQRTTKSASNTNKVFSDDLLQKQQQTNNSSKFNQSYGSNTTLMTDTSGYMSADGFNLNQANNNNVIANNNQHRILHDHQEQNRSTTTCPQVLNSEEVLIDPSALRASDLSLINQTHNQVVRKRQPHPQENMSQYQRHQIKQYHKKMDANSEQKGDYECEDTSLYLDLQMSQLQQQQLLQSPSRQQFNGYQNFRIVPQPIQGIPNAGSKPILVFVNPRSGGNQGAKMMQKFNWLLNPRQVFDLIEAGGPRAALELYRDVPNLRILTIGGDGTASWILSYLDEVGISNKIPVAVLPLGTGNDLARALGWGGGYTDEPIAKILTQVRDGEIVQLDRWNLQVEKNYEIAPISPNEFSTSSGIGYTAASTMETSPPSNTSSPSYFGSLSQNNTNTASTISIIDQTNCDTSMIQVNANSTTGFNPSNDESGTDRLPMDVINNYFSFGVDAHIALEFHTAREAHPERFNSRLRNKMFYGQAGGKDLLKRKWKDLSNFVTLYCDGHDMTSRLKELKVHSVLFLNIPSYGGGTRPWPTTATSFAKPRTDDGLIEVIGLTTYQLPLLQAGGHGTCIAQCKNAKIITSRTIPMQVDGEPCKLLPSIINISFRNRVCMLAKSKSSNKNINMTNSNIQKMN